MKQTINKIAAFAALTFSSISFAAVPTGVDAALTSLQGDITSTITLAIPVVIAVSSLFVIVRVVKKVISKAG